MTIDNKEFWKPIDGFENIYEISNIGNVKSLERSISDHGGFRLVRERILRPGKNRRGYTTVLLNSYGKSHTRYVHRLVIQAFIPNLENKRTVNHKDGIKSNNKIDNLEWATDSENIKHAFVLGLKGGLSDIGENNHNSKLTNKQVCEIRNRYIFRKVTYKYLADIYKVSISTIEAVISGRNWRKI